MAAIAHDLLDQGFPFLMEKPMGVNAPEVEAVAAKAARLDAFVAVPLAQRYRPFATRARELRPRRNSHNEGRDHEGRHRPRRRDLPERPHPCTLFHRSAGCPLDHWRRGAAPPISVHDLRAVVRLIDQAYERAG